MSDYIVQIKIKNGPMLRAMRRNGIFTASELARRVDACPSTIGRLLNLKMPAVDMRGMWYPVVMKIAELLKTMPQDLFPRQHIKSTLKKNTAEVSMSSEQILTIADQSRTLEQKILSQSVNNKLFENLSCLTERQEYVIIARYGLNCHEKTLEEIAKDLGITRERIRQIEAKALRVLSSRMKEDKPDFITAYK